MLKSRINREGWQLPTSCCQIEDPSKEQTDAHAIENSVAIWDRLYAHVRLCACVVMEIQCRYMLCVDRMAGRFDMRRLGDYK